MQNVASEEDELRSAFPNLDQDMGGGDLATGDLTQAERDDILEQEHFQSIIRAFLFYRQHALVRVNRFEHCMHQLPPRHRALLPTMDDVIAKKRLLIEHNYNFLRMLISSHAPYEPAAGVAPEEFNFSGKLRVSEMDSDKVQSTLRQFIRDWSDEGKLERDACYKPIIDALLDHFGPLDQGKYASPPSVLVCGAGLGRLAWELARLGFDAQGNEFSYFMLLASNFVLNMTSTTYEYTIFPYIHQQTNVFERADEQRGVRVPNVVTSDLPPDCLLSMAAGDFLDVYGPQKECWDAVSSCFFIDTARNIVEYIEIIARMLKPGGIFVNIGPLLYHFADMPEHQSIELTYDELKPIMESYGLHVTHEERRKAQYASNDRSMMSIVYNCVFFIAEKRGDGADDGGDKGGLAPM